MRQRLLAPLAEKARRYGPPNSYDLLKFIALATMLTDHFGAYLFHDTEWLRAVGRAAAPLFLFLVGYSGNYRITRELVVAALAVLLLHAVFRYPIFPLDILFTVLLTRLALEWLRAKSLVPGRLHEVIIVSAVFFLPAMMLADYGVFGLLISLCGYLRRFHPGWKWTFPFMLGVLAAHFTFQCFSLSLGGGGMAIVATIAMATLWYLREFELSKMRIDRLPAPAVTTLLFISRNSLLFYVAHLAVLMALGSWLVEPPDRPFIWIDFSTDG